MMQVIALLKMQWYNANIRIVGRTRLYWIKNAGRTKELIVANQGWFSNNFINNSEKFESTSGGVTISRNFNW